MKGLTLAQVRAARDGDEAVVAAVRRRLEAEQGLEALTHLDGLSLDELALLAQLERAAVAPLPDIEPSKFHDRKAS